MADPSLSPLDMTLVSPKFQKPYHEAGNDLALYNARRAIFHRADLKALQGLNPNDTKLYIQHRRRQPPRPQDHIFVNREIFTLASEQFEDFFSGEWIPRDEYEEDSDFSDTESNPPEDLFDARDDEESEEEFEDVEVTDSEEDEEEVEEEPEVADGEVFDWDWRPPSPPDSEREFPEDDRLPISTYQSTNGHPSIKVVAPDWYEQGLTPVTPRVTVKAPKPKLLVRIPKPRKEKPPPSPVKDFKEDGTTVQFGSLRTWRALSFYLSSGRLTFRPLRSSGYEMPVKGSIDDMITSSPKSMYRLAKKFGLIELADSALESIHRQLSEYNIVEELFCQYTSRYREIIQLEIDFLYGLGSPFPDKVRQDFKHVLRCITQGGSMPYSSAALEELLAVHCEYVAMNRSSLQLSNVGQTDRGNNIQDPLEATREGNGEEVNIDSEQQEQGEESEGQGQEQQLEGQGASQESVFQFTETKKKKKKGGR